MNEFAWMKEASNYLARDLKEKCTFNDFVRTNNNHFINTLITYSKTGRNDLNNLALELNFTRETLIQKLLDLRVSISDLTCKEEKEANTEFDTPIDTHQHYGVTTFRELAFFLDSFPEVLLKIPEDVWNKELEYLNIEIDQHEQERLNNMAIRFAQEFDLKEKNFESENQLIPEQETSPSPHEAITKSVSDSWLWDRARNSLQIISLSLERVRSMQNSEQFAIGMLNDSSQLKVAEWHIPSTPAEDGITLSVRRILNVVDGIISGIEFSITVDNSENLGDKSYDIAIMKVIPGSTIPEQAGRIYMLSSKEPRCEFCIPPEKFDTHELAVRLRENVDDI